MEILTTSDYSKFKLMPCGNREVKEPHVQQIMDWIKNKGQTQTIIAVNENMEILDGQHRFEAFKRLGLPVSYTVFHGATFEDCILMNASQTPWTIDDYIYAHSRMGNANYIALSKLIDTYGELGISVITNVVSRRKHGVAHPKATSAALRSGDFQFPFEAEEDLKNEFEYLMKFQFVRKKKGHGRNDIFFNALSACYECPYINNDRLLERMTENTDKFGAYNTFKDCLECIQTVYNMYARNKVYLSHEVEQMLDNAKASAKGGVA